MSSQWKSSRYNVFFLEKGSYYVANTLTGTILQLNTNEYDALRSNSYFALEDTTLFELKKQGVIVNALVDEIGLLRHAYVQSRFNKEKARLTICPTLECNFSCPYCYEKRQSGAMSVEVQIGVIQYIKDIISLGIKLISIVWYGGEPLLYPNIIENLSLKIIELCKKNNVGFVCSMITNGFLINEHILQMFEKINLTNIQITVDGDEKTHDSRRKLCDGGPTYQKIVNNIQALSRYPIHVTVRTNIDKTNIGSFAILKDKMRLKNENAVYIPALVTQEATQSTDQRSKCFTYVDRSQFYKYFISDGSFLLNLDDCLGQGIVTCAAEHYYSSVIDPQGFRYQCMNEVGNPKYAIASVIDNKKCSETAIAKYFGRDPFSEEECRDCVYLPLCYGGCVWEYKDKGVHSCVASRYIFEDMIRQKLL